MPPLMFETSHAKRCTVLSRQFIFKTRGHIVLVYGLLSLHKLIFAFESNTVSCSICVTCLLVRVSVVLCGLC